MPAQMSDATELPSGAVAAAWSWYVVQRNAPGAISAIAFIVAPVSPSVGFTPVAVVSSAMGCTSWVQPGATDMPRHHAEKVNRNGDAIVLGCPRTGQCKVHGAEKSSTGRRPACRAATV